MDMKQLTDYELITNCINGDNSFFSELVTRYKNLVYSIILRMTNDSEEANDLAQEVFIKVYRSLEKYRPDFKFSTWIIRVTTNHVIDHRRKRRAETTFIDDLEGGAVPSGNEPSPEDVFLKKEQKKQLKEVVGALPDMYKIPIVLYHQQGLSYQEISEVIEEPLSKVKNRIFRGRKMLKESLLQIRGGDNYVLW